MTNISSDWQCSRVTYCCTSLHSMFLLAFVHSVNHIKTSRCPSSVSTVNLGSTQSRKYKGSSVFPGGTCSILVTGLSYTWRGGLPASASLPWQWHCHPHPRGHSPQLRSMASGIWKCSLHHHTFCDLGICDGLRGKGLSEESQDKSGPSCQKNLHGHYGSCECVGFSVHVCACRYTHVCRHTACGTHLSRLTIPEAHA